MMVAMAVLSGFCAKWTTGIIIISSQAYISLSPWLGIASVMD